MKLYSRLFSDYGHTVAQILLTKDVIDQPDRRAAAEDTFSTLLGLGCIPIVNENDSVSTEGLNFGGNDTLSAYVALVCHADLLINLSDIDGLYDKDPRRNTDARLISRVDSIDDDVLAMAGGAGTARGTGGMATKLLAARIVLEKGIPMYILNGQDPTVLYDLMDGKQVGTFFAAK
jgi:glutamate 5-kinase